MLIRRASEGFSGAGRRNLRPGGPATRRPTKKSRRLSKKFAEKVAAGSEEHSSSSSGKKPLEVMAFDEARFGLINRHRRRYCPKGFRPPYTAVRRAYEWTYLYAAVDPTTGESFCTYLPGMEDGLCLEAFLKHLGGAYADHRLLAVLDGASSHTSGQIGLPENVSLMRLPA